MEEILHLILLFFFYSFLGWCMEVVLKYIQFHRFINRGFYTGPICPIYGYGAILITLTIQWISPFESAVGTTFAISFTLCGLLEYFTSYFMEKRFHARWWDYSNKPMNLHGRIWIGNLVLFGLGGVAIIHILNPVLLSFLNSFSLLTKEVVLTAFIAVFAADYVLTHFMMKLIKSGIERSEADSTEAMNREIRLLLSNRNIFYRRFADAYPNVIYQTERIKNRVNSIREEAERIRREAERQITEQKKQVVSRVEPSTLVKSEIIEKQDRLIRLLYNETAASEEMRLLKKEIDSERQRLDARPLSKIIHRGI
ncbi:MAG TPA: putative ABC transporter permease [Clostridia bacterium]|nr:putative ABC transporter permease [Clostridia bacterium]HQO55658.1 putative ABC transporter permease [Clostridia bacterium]